MLTKDTYMNHFLDEVISYAKITVAFALAWFTDLVVLQFASLSIVSSDVREFLIEFKEVISIMVSISLFVLTIFKIRNEIRNKGKKED